MPKAPAQDLREDESSSTLKKGLYSLGVIVIFITVGTLGFHFIEGFSYVDSFYVASMIATGQGLVSPLCPSTATGKIFASLLAFVSVGFILAAFGFFFGTFFGRVWKKHP